MVGKTISGEANQPALFGIFRKRKDGKRKGSGIHGKGMAAKGLAAKGATAKEVAAKQRMGVIIKKGC